MLVTSHAERVCGEYRRALSVLHTLHAWGQSDENRAESVETLSFALLFCGQSPGVWWGSNIWSETQRIRLLSRCKEASGNWRGETTCCEYRWEQLLTPAAQQSAVRLDKAKRTALRRIQLYIGLSIQAVTHPPSIDAYLLAPYLHLIFFCSIPEVKTGCLPSVLLEAHRKPIDLPKNPNQARPVCGSDML